jgi:hypothetical protein
MRLEKVLICFFKLTSALFLTGKCRSTIKTYVDVPLRLVFAGDRLDYGVFQYTSDFTPVVTSCKFLADVSGLIIDFDIPTNRGVSGGADINTVIYQAAADIFVDPSLTLGIGALVTWLNPQQLIVNFGANATCTSSTFLQIQPFKIASSFDSHAFVSGQFLPDVIEDRAKPPTTAVISVPESISYCLDWTINGLASKGGGGRQLGYAWDVQVFDFLGSTVDKEWTRTLRNKILRISTPQIHVRNNATWNTASSELKTCSVCKPGVICPDDSKARMNADACCQCDMFPGYAYSWRLVTYSWLWAQTASCGTQPVPATLWSNPEAFRLCPATSLNSGKQMGCDVPGVVSSKSTCPWAWSKMFIDNTTSPTLDIQTPSILSVLSGQAVTLIAKFTPNICAPNLIGGSSTDQMARMVRNRWRLLRILGDSFSFDACKPQRGSFDEIFLPTNASFPINIIDPIYLNAGSKYGISVESFLDPAVYSGGRVCSSRQIFVSPQNLDVQVTMGIFLNASDTQVNGQIFGPENHGVDIGNPEVTDSSKQLQIAKFTAKILNRDSNAFVRYTYTWTCRYWVLDTYQPWVVLSSDKAAPDPNIVIPCNCTPAATASASYDGPCPKQWTGQGQLELGSQVMVSERAYISRFNTTFEYSVLVQEIGADNLQLRSTTGVKYATFYHQIPIEQQYAGMMDRHVDIKVQQKSTTSAPALNKAIAGQTLLLSGIAEGVSVNSFSTNCFLAGSCSYVWTVLSEKLNLADQNVSRFGARQTISGMMQTKALFYLNPGSVPADRNFMIRLYATNDVGSQFVLNFKDIPITVSGLPSNGDVNVEPTCGTALVQQFTAHALGWSGEQDDLPLQYSFASRRAGCDKYFNTFSQFLYVPETMFYPSFCGLGNGSCTGTSSSACSLLEIELTVRTQFFSIQKAYTTANIWRTQWIESPLPYSGKVTCRGLMSPQSRDNYLNITLEQGRSLTYIYKNLDVLLISLRNVANVLNSENLEDTERGKYMNFILKELIGAFATPNLLPDSSESMSMIASALVELYMSPVGQDFVCKVTEQDQMMLSEVLVSISRQMAAVHLEVSHDVLQNLASVFDIIVRCRLTSTSPSAGARRVGMADPLSPLNDKIVANLCQAQLGNSYGGENLDAIVASTFAVQYTRKPSMVGRIKLEVLSPGNSRCGPITLESSGDGVGNWLESIVDVCVQVYFFNPVDYPNIKSLSLRADGTDQKQYGIKWPVSDNMCPVFATFRRKDEFVDISPAVVISFDLSNSPLIARNWFPPQSPDIHSLQQSWASNPQPNNLYAYADISFAGSCQQYAESQDQSSPPTWAYDFINDHTQIYDSSSRVINAANVFNLDAVDYCQKIHVPVDPDPTTLAVKVKCTFSSNLNGINSQTSLPTSYSLKPLYAVITERADCQGVPDTRQDLLSYYDFDIGQFEYARNLTLPRKSQNRLSRQVCDRCARCGGFNDACTLACDGIMDSPRTLDQCGICGGSCLAPSCPVSQCNAGYVVFSTGGASVTKMTFGFKLACPADNPSSCQVIRSLNSCPGGCPREVMRQIYPIDTSFLTIYEGSTYTFEPGNLTLKSASSTSVFNMHICVLNRACSQYILEVTNIGKVPTCEQLYSEQPACARQCRRETDLWDPRIFCAGGSMTLATQTSVCKLMNTQGNSSTLIQCSGTASAITAAVSKMQFTPPPRYTSGKPPVNNLTMRFSFDEFDPMIYRKDINITVLPVNNAPIIEGGTIFRLQEDRPLSLNASTNGQPLSISIYDDAEFQAGSIINVQISISTLGLDNKSFATSLSIGGSQRPPLCFGCLSSVILVDESGCRCAGGVADTIDNPWYLASQPFIIKGPPRHVNLTLQSIEFQSGPSMNQNSPTAMNGGVPNVVLKVFSADNGYADQRRTNTRIGNAPNLTATSTVKVDYVDENDPPMIYMPGEVVLFQTEQATIVGSHIVDGDGYEYFSSAMPSYVISIVTTHGQVGISYSSSNCTIQFPTFIVVRRQLLRTSSPPFLSSRSDAHVEERDPQVSYVGKNTYGLLIDGTASCPDNPDLGCTRTAYMQFDLSSTAASQWQDLSGRSSPWSDILSYDGSTLTLRIYRMGCARTLCNASASQDVPAQYCELQPCSSQGAITVKAVSCADPLWLSSGLTFQSLSLLQFAVPPTLLGSAFANLSDGSEQWLDIPLNTTAISKFRQYMPLTPDRLCLVLEGDSKQNETNVFFGGQLIQTSALYQRSIANPLYRWVQYPTSPNPELAIVRGRAWNCTGMKCDQDCTGSSGMNIYSEACLNSSIQMPGSIPSPCTVQVQNGSGIRGRSITFQTGIDPANLILDMIHFFTDSPYSNIFHQNDISNVSITVQDITAKYPTINAGGWADDGENLLYISKATTYIKIITIKTGPLSVQMSPLYSEAWLNNKLQSGELPTYVLLEDCGNRPIEDCEDCPAECPTKLQIIPGTGAGAEAAFAQMAVEITTQLGFITIPKSLRSFLTFQKGTGYRDSTVRFYGKAGAVRLAAQALVYHTKQDQSVEFKNSLVGKCSRPCFLNDIAAAKFLNAKEPVGCQQGCSTEIYNRVNNFGQTMSATAAGETSGTYLDSIFITFEDKGSTGIGLLNYIQVFMYTIYTLAVNDNPCVVFASSEISVGCRDNCANVQWSSVCSPVYDSNMDVISNSGFPFDVTPPKGAGIRNYREDDTSAVKIGALLIKPVDLYESARSECKNLLLLELGKRGEAGHVLPSWVSECPQIAVHIQATRGEVSLNNRYAFQVFALVFVNRLKM